jgi:hypothetical protein
MLLQRRGPIPLQTDIRDRIARQWAASRSLEEIDLRLRKRIPSVLFIPADDPRAWLANDEALCRALVEWISAKRRSTVALAAVRTFLRAYPTATPRFGALRDGLLHMLSSPGVAKPGTLLDRWRVAGHLETNGSRRVAIQLLRDGSRPDSAFESAGLNGGLEASAFTYSCFGEITSIVERRTPADEPALISRCLLLVETENAGLRFGDPLFRTKLVNALLGPLANRDPAREVRDRLFKFCLRHLGDPRARDARWADVSPNARDVMVKWLVQESFDVYFQILDRTADEHHWSYRRPFWERYLRRGDVIDAWAVLGKAAAEVARTQRVRRESYGVMRTGDRSQSALLLRIRGARGNVAVAEWSHNGSCRIWADDRKYVPPFYQREYEPDSLRRFPDKEIAHHGSERHGWQNVISSHLMSTFGVPS